MNYYDKIASKMMLNTLLYSISELSKVNIRIKRIIKNINMIIQVSIHEGGSTEYLEIKNNAIHFERKKEFNTHNAEIHFKNPSEFIKILMDTKLDLSRLESEKRMQFRYSSDFKKSCEEIINIALPYSNNTLGENISSEDEVIQVKIILYAFIIGLQEIFEEDESFREEIKDFNGIIKMDIIDGPKCYLKFQDGTYTGFMGNQVLKPNVIITMKDLKTARDLVTGKADTMKLIIKGNILINGDSSQVMKLMNLNELLSDYSDYIKQKQKKMHLKVS
ncbi:MAG: SCP2 sterol-binding domain-containing protein [Candidatus Helarchaeota archaeon]